MPLVTLDTVTFHTPDGRPLFDNFTLTFGREKTGLVGRNGAGKTTLVRLILGEVAPTSGSVAVAGRLAVLRQTLDPPPGAALADLIGVAESIARLDRLERGEAQEGDLETADWTLPVRLDEALAKVGLGATALDRPATSLSGGEATRAALASLLVAEPDLIIMDEPTNNLDAGGRLAVAELLTRWKGGALVISHDRELLRPMDRIVELSSLGAKVYGGGYDLYAERKAAEEAAAARELEDAERTVARVNREVQVASERKQKRDAAGRRAAQRGDVPKIVLGAMKRRAQESGGRQTLLAQRLQATADADLKAAEGRVERARGLVFDLPSSGLAAGKLVLAFDDMCFAWPGLAPVLHDLSFRMTGPERIAVTGPNSSGKTTLIGLVVGNLTPTAGRVVRGVSAALLDQRTSLLREPETLLGAFRRLNPETNDNAAHAALARFLFRNDAALKRVGDLSGGERLRAALACVLMAAQPPQLIVLDEPTNHLDLDSIAAVEAALRGYDGALLVVSHDRDFLDAIDIDREIRLGLASP